MVTLILLGDLHVVAEFVFLALICLDTPFSEPLDGFGVPHPKERLLGFDESRVGCLNGFCGYWILQCEINDTTDKGFDVRQKIVERNPVKLRFDVRIL